ncbi:glycosyltransferase family 2 protein [Christiangramia aquimixticola]|uniref:glycosyltransferase family 2 protein n=1 Tax=Christiangramia aquimixticola TaxID=1697558 RepID=UPI003AA8B368
MLNKISIIIPCFNSEKTLYQTLDSLLKQTFSNWEAIIVDDGSIDNTKSISASFILKDKRFKYYYKENKGLGKARNYGIERAEGEFILPLDSDNLVDSEFCELAIEIFKSKNIGVVHGHAELFGEKSGLWHIEKFNFEKLLVQNYIDACAIFRKSLWEQVGGYDEKMPHQGNEDWDLWLSFGRLGVEFFHLDKVTFKYRIRTNSMIRQYSDEIRQMNENYIATKYAKEYRQVYLNYRNHELSRENNPLASAIFYFKKFLKL